MWYPCFMLIKVLSLALVAFTYSQAAAVPQAPVSDKDAVYLAALDYVDALYKADPSKIEKSVHPSLTKRGFYRPSEGAPYGPMGTMTFQELFTLAGTWNKDGKRDTSIKKVEVLDVTDQTAVAKVTALWGIDHMQLAKFGGKWQIVNIVWQSHPVAK
jgi:hypothetical protein